MLYSSEIEEFSEANSLVSEKLAKANLTLIDKVPHAVKSKMEHQSNIETGYKLNEILESKGFDNYEIKKELPLANINLLMFKDVIKVKDNFITDNGYLILDSQVLYSEDGKLIAELQLEKNVIGYW